MKFTDNILLIGAECVTDHYVVVATIREKLPLEKGIKKLEVTYGAFILGRHIVSDTHGQILENKTEAIKMVHTRATATYRYKCGMSVP